MSGKGKAATGGRGKKGKSSTRSAKAGLQFPVGRVARYLKKGRLRAAHRRWCPGVPRGCARVPLR
ncbi:hypothetical protein PINS_up013487 [Pythium insidiosum]|nr:hypothetical protein PINS_up013487 [Pythium insidiosum]